MAVKIRKPAKTITFPPTSPAPRKTYSYATGGKWTKGKAENWGSIAADHGVSNVWDLIMFNFGCRNPAEVNWCMKEFLKCTKSNDGNNYSFSPSDAKPDVYIPPIGYTAISADDTVARELVLDILSRPEVKKFAFETPAAKVTAKLYADVLTHVKSQTILCEDGTASLPTGVLGAWKGAENTLAIRNPEKRTVMKLAVVLHEATHAGLDVQKQSMLTLDGEAAGYIAEMCFSILVNKIPLTFDPFSPTLSMSTIRRWAAALAKDVLEHRASGKTSPYPITNANYKLYHLRENIRADPTHRSEVSKPHAADGV
jgi:hypothetical protein